MTIRFAVRGDVQGVGYRAFTQRAAQRHRIAGWVQNERDGRVTGAASGEDDDVARFLDALRRGPEGGRVDALDVVDDPVLDAPIPFQIRR